MKRSPTSSLHPILRNNLHQTPRMRSQMPVSNPLPNFLRNTLRLDHSPIPLITLILSDHGSITRRIEHQWQYAHGCGVVLDGGGGVSICLEVVVGGSFGGTVAYHAGGWGECGGCSDDDKKAFG